MGGKTPGRLRRFAREKRGATSIEYALVAVGIAVAVAATVTGLGQKLRTDYYDTVNAATAQ